MNKIVLVAILLLISVKAWPQSVDTLTDTPSKPLQHIGVLAGDYSLQDIQTKAWSLFTANDSLRPAVSSTYWLKITIYNPFPGARPFTIRMQPALHNKLYYFDANASDWLSDEGGVQAAKQSGHLDHEVMKGILRAGETNFIFIAVDISSPGNTGKAFLPQVILEKEAVAGKEEKLIWVSWIISIVVLLLLMLNNVYLFFSYKDKSILFFLLAQWGGMICITAYKQIFQVLFTCPVLTTGWLANGQPAWYDLNDLILQAGMALVMYGLVQGSRSYLNTRQWIPRLDTILRYGLNGYLIISGAGILMNAVIFYAKNEAWLFEIVTAVLLLMTIIIAGILVYRRQQPAPMPYLWINMLSLFLSWLFLYII